MEVLSGGTWSDESARTTALVNVTKFLVSSPSRFLCGTTPIKNRSQPDPCDTMASHKIRWHKHQRRRSLCAVAQHVSVSLSTGKYLVQRCVAPKYKIRGLVHRETSEAGTIFGLCIACHHDQLRHASRVAYVAFPYHPNVCGLYFVLPSTNILPRPIDCLKFGPLATNPERWVDPAQT